MTDLIPYIVDRAKKSNARHEIHSFSSGAVMIDIFIKDKCYVVQIYGESIGLSLLTEETAFDTIPDKVYTVATKFKSNFEKIFS